MKRLHLLLIAGLLFFCSCQKSTNLTQGELNAQRLTKDLTGVPVTLVYVWNGSADLAYTGGSISVSTDGTAIVFNGSNKATVSLETLKYYTLMPAATNGYLLNLYY